MGLDVSTETHQVLRHESCLINQPGPQDAPTVLDSGCSVSVTPFKEDFPGGIKETEDTEMHGLKDAVEIAGEGIVEWEIGDVFGGTATVRTRAYWIPSARARLCSTQTCFQENKSQPCSLVQTHDKVQ